MLAETATLRLKSMPARVAAVLAIAVVLYLGYGWAWLGGWALLYAALSLCERFTAVKLTRAGAEGSRLADGAYVALVAATSLSYGALAVPLALMGGGDGEVFAFVLLSGGLLNALTVSRESRAIFLATSGAYAGYLIGVPLLEQLSGVSEPEEWVTSFGGLMLAAHAYGAWRTLSESLRAEAAARAELALRSDEAERAVAAKSAFVATVSHELRTPLSGILAAGAVLEASKADVARKRQAAEVVVDAGRFMQTLLDDLLDLAKLDAGKMSVEAVDFDIGALVWSLERHWSAAARGAGKPLQLVSASGLPAAVSGDPTRLRQILNNLLSNAVKFTGAEGVRWTVDVCVGPEGSALTVRVSDTGPGMNPEQLDRLFTAFDQTDAAVARTHGGTGLGLAVSRELARAMGGELRVESEVGRGSTFVLSLPLGTVAAPVRAAAPVVVEAPRTQPLRLLVVDDHEINRRTMTLLLQPSGAEVTAVDGAAAALGLLRAEAFDAVLTDINMPGMNGLELTRALRNEPGPNQATPVIAVTGGDSPAEVAACEQWGLASCVAKPIEVGALYAALEAALTSDAEEAKAGAPRAA